jgi:two-component system response regulator HydG
MRARLAVLDGDARPNLTELTPERPISIGRSRDNNIVLPGDYASRLHARLYYESGRWFVRDFGLNGTHVNESRINQVAELNDGTEIRIGEVKFKFQIEEASSSSIIRHTPIERLNDSAAPSTNHTRLGIDDLTALNQFMTAAAEAKDSFTLTRLAIHSIFYQTGAALVGFFNLDPNEPLAKVILPESGVVDEHLCRQLTRRMHRDHRLVWMAEDTAATLPTNGIFHTTFDDALALPVKTTNKAIGSIHAYKSNGYFTEKDKRYAEGVTRFASFILESLRSRRVLEAENARLKSRLPDGDELLGDSPRMVALREELARAVLQPKPILFQGESGVGKESAALAAHRRSSRKTGPFVPVRCTTTPSAVLEAELFGYRKGAFSGAEKDHPGLVALADEGTLFFDEIADLPFDCQSKLVKLIESRTFRPIGATYDVRVDVGLMAATQRNLELEVQQGRFRPELLSLINQSAIVVPPLREHAEDVPHLVQFFLDRIGGESRQSLLLESEAIRFLREQPWPGNVRQLLCILEAAASRAPDDLITLESLRSLF